MDSAILHTVQQDKKYLFSEARPIVPDFTIFVNGSSCNGLFFCLILALFFLFRFIGISKAGWDANR